MSEKSEKNEEASDETPKVGSDGKPLPKEIGGPKGPEPTRHGEWEVNGRVVDF